MTDYPTLTTDLRHARWALEQVYFSLQDATRPCPHGVTMSTVQAVHATLANVVASLYYLAGDNRVGEPLATWGAGEMTPAVLLTQALTLITTAIAGGVAEGAPGVTAVLDHVRTKVEGLTTGYPAMLP